MAIGLLGTPSGNQAEVDATSKGLIVQQPKTLSQAGFGLIAGQIDAGSITGTPLNRNVAVSTSNRLAMSMVTPLFTDTFNYAAQDSARWNVALTTFTMGYAAGFMTLNNSSVTTAAATAMIRSYCTIPLPTEGAVVFRMYGFQTQIAQTNCTTEFGFLWASGVAAATDGIFFRFDATGTLKGVLNYNGTEITTSAITPPTNGNMAEWQIVLDDSRAEFWINGVLRDVVIAPTSVGAPLMHATLQVGMRMFHAGTAPALANQLRVAAVDVWATDGNINKSWQLSRAEQGYMSYQGVSGMTMGSTALYANSANPTAAVPTNTTAALGSGLGGQFWETATLAVNTDGVIASFQVPADTINISGRKLVITGVRWMSIVQAALTGGPFVYQHGIAFGHTGVSLATAEAAATKAPRRIPIGVSTFAAAAAVGTIGANLSHTFTSPIVVNPGEFIQTFVKNMGTVGTAGTIHHSITFDGYWA